MHYPPVTEQFVYHVQAQRQWQWVDHILCNFFFLSRLSEPRMFRNLYVDKSGMAAQEDRFACLLTANSKFFWFCKNPNGSAEMIG